MKILTKYLLKSLLGPLFYCLLGFSLLFIINDLFDNFSDFLSSDIGFVAILHYYALLMLPAMVMILPACLLLSILYSLSSLTRHSEIIAMRAGGISIYRIIVPYMGVGVVATLLCAFLAEKVAPQADYDQKQFLNYYTSGQREDTFFSESIALKNGENDWYIQRMNTQDRSLYGVRLECPRTDAAGRVKYEAEKAFWADGSWWFTDVTVQLYDEKGDLDGAPQIVLQKQMRSMQETPETFLIEVKGESRFLSAEEIIYYLQSKKELSENRRIRLQVDLHAKLATPLVCIIVTLFGIPVGAHTGRRGALAGIMTAISLFFVFYALQLIMQYLAKQGLVPPWVGGWLPIILCGIGAPILIHRMR